MNIKQMAVAALAASAVFSAAAETELVGGAKVSPDEPLNAWRTIPLPRAIISRR